VRDGALVGKAPVEEVGYSCLGTERQAFGDLHLQAEARSKDSGESGLFFRRPGGGPPGQRSPSVVSACSPRETEGGQRRGAACGCGGLRGEGRSAGRGLGDREGARTASPRPERSAASAWGFPPTLGFKTVHETFTSYGSSSRPAIVKGTSPRKERGSGDPAWEQAQPCGWTSHLFGF
jgi:hypothetical protein